MIINYNYKKRIKKIYNEEGYLCAIIFTHYLFKSKKIKKEEFEKIHNKLLKNYKKGD